MVVCLLVCLFVCFSGRGRSEGWSKVCVQKGTSWALLLHNHVIWKPLGPTAYPSLRVLLVLFVVRF